MSFKTDNLSTFNCCEGFHDRCSGKTTGGKACSCTCHGSNSIPMILTCPNSDCCKRHVDQGEHATKPHHTHACQHCGMVWRPAIVPTVGVQFLPGFKDGEP